MIKKIYNLIFNNGNNIKVLDKSKIEMNPTISHSNIRGEITIDKNCTINNSNLKGKISLSNNISVLSSNLLGQINVGEGCKFFHAKLYGKVEIGKYTSLWGPNLDIHQKVNNVTIGSFCSIARNVTMQEYNHNLEKITTYFIGQNLFKENWKNERVSKGLIEIGSDVWIGTQCTILGGAKIGHGAMIAANSVVIGEIPPYAIVAGSPAKVIKYRFSPDIIEKLLALKWWEWSIEKIKENKTLFESELTKGNLYENK